MQNLSNQLRFYYNSTDSRPMSSFSTECSIMVPHEEKCHIPPSLWWTLILDSIHISDLNRNP